MVATESIKYPSFSELTEEAKQEEIASMAGFLGRESERFIGFQRIYNLGDAMSELIMGELVRVQPSSEYGIVNPIRDRRLGQLLSSENQGSLPVLKHDARLFLDRLASCSQDTSRGTGFVEALSEAGYSDFRLSVTSLLRVSDYQRKIARDGQLTVGIKGSKFNCSVHELGYAFDIDHCGFYAKDIATGQEESINPVSNLGVLEHTLKAFRETVLDAFDAANTPRFDAELLPEVMQGRGVFHISAIENQTKRMLSGKPKFFSNGVN